MILVPLVSLPALLLLALVAAVAVIAFVPEVRRKLVTGPVMTLLERAKLLPVISETERVALEAGTVWLDGEIFSGCPDWKRVLAEPYPDLSAEERAFLDGPVERACALVDDWDVYRAQDLPPKAWAFLKRERFFAMIIPREHGGLGFSARAHAAVVSKLASRCIPLAVTVMVPNSLGPAELLVHHGTPEQRKRYLPKLATGELMPCFALTEPGAGSDAGAMTSSGVVFRGKDGKLALRLDWNKRYITLAAVSNLIGLAFKLHDPDNLLGKGTEPGITCALIPSETDGVVLGRRHDPLGVPFINGPTEGHGVVVSVDQIIGGAEGAGQGWRMLMETLAAGRGISLPSLSVGCAKTATRVASAHATVRRQFGLPLAKFEGIEEPLARMAGLTYMMEAAQVFTCGAIDGGAKPSVITAISKYLQTELARGLATDAMDVSGGTGIVRGPRNLLANGYIAQPISITVEGANILTRSMIIFGQGAIRCHPHALKEMDALARKDLPAFDAAFSRHVLFVVRTALWGAALTLTRGLLAPSPVSGPTARYYRKLTWASARFALLADLAMGTLGGDLKRREKLTGRFADVLCWTYFGMSTLRRYEAEGRREEDLPFVHWSLKYALSRVQLALEGILQNFPVPVLGAWLRGPALVLARLNPICRPPSDALGGEVARLVRQPSEQRARLTSGLYMPSDPKEAMRRLEDAFALAWQAEDVVAKLKRAVREGRVPKDDPATALAQAVSSGVLTRAEGDLLTRAEKAAWDYVQVDSFDAATFAASVPLPGPAAARAES